MGVFIGSHNRTHIGTGLTVKAGRKALCLIRECELTGKLKGLIGGLKLGKGGGEDLTSFEQGCLVVLLWETLLHQPPVEREWGEGREGVVVLLKQALSHGKPELFQIDPCRTHICAAVAVGTQIGAIKDDSQLMLIFLFSRYNAFEGLDLF